MRFEKDLRQPITQTETMQENERHWRITARKETSETRDARTRNKYIKKRYTPLQKKTFILPADEAESLI